MIKEIFNKDIGESVKIYTHKSGLKVYVCEKPDYSSAYTIFGTRYGSIDTKFRVSDGELLIILSISCLNQKSRMLLKDFQKQARLPMLLLRLTVLVICFPVRRNLKKTSEFCLILCNTRILLRKL